MAELEIITLVSEATQGKEPDYIMMNPSNKVFVPDEWRDQPILEIRGIKIIWNVDTPKDKIICLKEL